jgi:hypothetical protein
MTVEILAAIFHRRSRDVLLVRLGEENAPSTRDEVLSRTSFGFQSLDLCAEASLSLAPGALDLEVVLP